MCLVESLYLYTIHDNNYVYVKYAIVVCRFLKPEKKRKKNENVIQGILNEKVSLIF